MKEGKTALFIGRFQPFHLGHYSVVSEMDRDPGIQRILIGVGSSEDANTEHNPFSFREREAMISLALKKRIKKPVEIFGIPDVFNASKWLKLVKLLAPRKFSVVYTGNSWVGGIFDGTDIEVLPIKAEIIISGTKIRKMIKKGRNGEKFVLPEIAKAIRNLGGFDRIKRTSHFDFQP